MAPECLSRKHGRPAFASDVFSVGIILWRHSLKIQRDQVYRARRISRAAYKKMYKGEYHRFRKRYFRLYFQFKPKFYFWILLIQAGAYIGKLVVHPEPLISAGQFVERARIGPVPGSIVLVLGTLYCMSWGIAAGLSWRDDARRARTRATRSGMG